MLGHGEPWQLKPRPFTQCPAAWCIAGGAGRSWAELGGAGRSWAELGGAGRSWAEPLEIAGHGVPRASQRHLVGSLNGCMQHVSATLYSATMQLAVRRAPSESWSESWSESCCDGLMSLMQGW